MAAAITKLPVKRNVSGIEGAGSAISINEQQTHGQFNRQVRAAEVPPWETENGSQSHDLRRGSESDLGIKPLFPGCSSSPEVPPPESNRQAGEPIRRRRPRREVISSISGFFFPFRKSLHARDFPRRPVQPPTAAERKRKSSPDAEHPAEAHSNRTGVGPRPEAETRPAAEGSFFARPEAEVRHPRPGVCRAASRTERQRQRARRAEAAAAGDGG